MIIKNVKPSKKLLQKLNLKFISLTNQIFVKIAEEIHFYQLILDLAINNINFCRAAPLE